MIINLQEDLTIGNTVQQYFYDYGKERFYLNDRVELIEEIEGKHRHTFIYNSSVYCFKWFKVKHSDGFITNRKIHYLVSDTTTKIPEDHIELYTYNLENPVSDIEEDLKY